ncbi:MAG: NAD(P)H-hydrate epimerase, partial [Clostridia bacterium]|nr:NAD(P)H-hydrate epimerase [Clostridia bacterium]
MKILDNEATKLLEENYVQSGVEHIKLMEAAGSCVARFIHDKYGLNGKNIAIVCGRGNNGGDGIACAKKLFEGGAKVIILLASGHPKTDDSIDLLGRAERMGLRYISYAVESERESFEKCITNADIIVDAIFGTGLKNKPDETVSEVIKLINLSKAKVVSVDVASGVCSDTGEVPGECVRANYSITFTTQKPCHVVYPGAEFCGKVLTASIGIDEDAVADAQSGMNTIDYQQIRLCFGKRKNNTSKGDYGKLLCVAGSRGMPGAAYFCSKAAVQSGVGLVRLATAESVYPIVAGSLHDAVYSPMTENEFGSISASFSDDILALCENSTAVLLGCGMGNNEETKKIVESVITNAKIPVILDADAINAIADNPEILCKRTSEVILTPHPGEMGRLVGKTAKEVQDSRFSTAKDFAAKYGVNIIL